jgi:hypothetical protein
MAGSRDSHIFENGVLAFDNIDSTRQRLSSSPGNSDASHNGGSSGGGENLPIESEGIQYNIEGYESPYDPTTPEESDEREALAADREPHRGVIRDLGKYQIFVRINMQQKGPY